MKRINILTVIVATGAAACGSTDVPDVDARLEADVTGDVTVHYEGDASFHTAFNPSINLPFFGLGSQNRHLVGLPTDGYESIHFSASQERPRVGTYPAGLWPTSLATKDGPFWFSYVRATNGMEEQYSSIGGSIEIAYSSSGRLEGTFDVVALLFCRRTQGSVMAESIVAGSCYPADLDYSLPRIRVVGSFIAARMPDDLEVINQSRVSGER